jgi:hypothetical protein
MHGIDIARKLTLDEYTFLRSRGFSFAARYLDGTLGLSVKSLSHDEVAIAHSRGVALLPVFELGGATFTLAQGSMDGAAARADALALGYPLGFPIVFAIDADVDPATLVDYFNGVFTGIDGAYVVGVYGSYRVCRYARENFPALGFFWQTYAWSGGLVYDAADVIQHANGVTLMPGLVVDLDFAASPIPWRLA